MRIGEMARRTGVAPSALRYYEDAGLLVPAGRTEAGYRLYGETALGRLAFIRRAQALGLTVRELHDLINAPSLTADADRERVRHLVAHKLDEADRRLQELEELREQLEELYVRMLRAPAPDCGHVGDCACWLPNDEEVKAMAKEVACCGQVCCPGCACRQGLPCDCPDCPCNQR